MMSFTRKFNKLIKIIKYRQQLRGVIGSYLNFYDSGEASFWGSIGGGEEEGIKKAILLASKYQGPIIEIGALFGHTTNLIASLKQLETPLIAVENFSWNPFKLSHDVHRQFFTRTTRYVLDHCNTEIFDGDKENFYLKNESLQPSMVFIDAAHDYESVKRDIDYAQSTRCPVVSGHDYSKNHPGVIKAVDESFAGNIDLYGSVWVHHRG